MTEILQVFPFDPRHFQLTVAEWARDVPGDVWPLSAVARSRHGDETSVHLIGRGNRRHETGSMPVFEHRSLTSGPALRQYGDDWSLSLERRLRALGPRDVCVIHQALETGARLANRAARTARVILVHHGGGALGWDRHLAAATRIVVLREDLAAALRAHCSDPAQIVTLPPSVDRRLFTPMEADFEDCGAPTLGFVGHVSHAKGAFEIPRVLAHLAAEGIDARVELAGPLGSDTTELHAALSAAGVRPRADLLGGMSNAEVAGRMRGWRLLLAPSYSEGYGRTILEALATRVPVAVVAGVVPAELEQRPGIGAAPRSQYPQLVQRMLRDPHRPPPPRWVPDHDEGAVAWDRLIDTLPPRPHGLVPPPTAVVRMRRTGRLRPLQHAEHRVKRGIRRLLPAG